jgi:hypothetical protein
MESVPQEKFLRRKCTGNISGARFANRSFALARQLPSMSYDLQLISGYAYPFSPYSASRPALFEKQPIDREGHNFTSAPSKLLLPGS